MSLHFISGIGSYNYTQSNNNDLPQTLANKLNKSISISKKVKNK